MVWYSNIEKFWFGMVKSFSDVEWFCLEWHSKTEHSDHSKFNQMATILDSYVLVPFWNGRDYGYICSYGPDHSNTKPSQIQILKRLDFEWALNSRVWYFIGDLKSDNLKFRNIWNPDFFKVRFQMVQFSNGWALAMALVPTIGKPDHLKSGHFFRISNDFLQNDSHLSGFQMGGIPDFRCHSKSRPFATQPVFPPFKIQTRSYFRSRLYTILYFTIQILDPKKSRIQKFLDFECSELG